MRPPWEGIKSEKSSFIFVFWSKTNSTCIFGIMNVPKLDMIFFFPFPFFF